MDKKNNKGTKESNPQKEHNSDMNTDLKRENPDAEDLGIKDVAFEDVENSEEVEEVKR